MEIKLYRRGLDTPFIVIHRNLCYCSGHECGATKERTTGYTFYFGKYAIDISYSKPKNCNAPF